MIQVNEPFEPVEVCENAPPLAPGQEWVEPGGRPHDRLVVQTIPDNAPPVIREGLARRRIQAVEGVCPCGGPMIWHDDPEVEAGKYRGQLITHATLAMHERRCPAGDPVFIPAMEEWLKMRQ